MKYCDAQHASSRIVHPHHTTESTIVIFFSSNSWPYISPRLSTIRVWPLFPKTEHPRCPAFLHRVQPKRRLAFLKSCGTAYVRQLLQKCRHNVSVGLHDGSTLGLANRVPELCNTVLEASQSLNVLHFSRQSRHHVSVNSCQRKNPLVHWGLATSNAVFTSKLATNAVSYRKNPGTMHPDDLPATSQCGCKDIRQQRLHVLTVDASLGANMQLLPFNRLQFFVKQSNHDRRIPLRKNRHQRNCPNSSGFLRKAER